jgi:hypothetical protein
MRTLILFLTNLIVMTHVTIAAAYAGSSKVTVCQVGPVHPDPTTVNTDA